MRSLVPRALDQRRLVGRNHDFTAPPRAASYFLLRGLAGGKVGQ